MHVCRCAPVHAVAIMMDSNQWRSTLNVFAQEGVEQHCCCCHPEGSSVNFLCDPCQWRRRSRGYRANWQHFLRPVHKIPSASCLPPYCYQHWRNMPDQDPQQQDTWVPLVFLGSHHICSCHWGHCGLLFDMPFIFLKLVGHIQCASLQTWPHMIIKKWLFPEELIKSGSGAEFIM